MLSCYTVHLKEKKRKEKKKRKKERKKEKKKTFTLYEHNLQPGSSQFKLAKRMDCSV